jgi:hypothetical protein
MKKKAKIKISQVDVLIKFFEMNQNRDISHPEVVDWATKYFKEKTGKVFRDPDRGIRKLHQQGMLIKIDNVVYRYDPKSATKKHLEDFTPALKRKILERDKYRCVICGRGKAEGMVLHVDHIKAKDFGGEATFENGQTLCSQHNFLKKNFKQTETGKKMFIRLYELSKSIGDNDLKDFASQILEVFEKNNINGHIEWKK